MNAFIKVVRDFFIIIAVFLIVGVLFLYILFPPVLSKEATEKDFVKNQDNIMVVNNYLLNSGYDSVYINDTDDRGTMFASSYGIVSIDDSQIIKALNTLLKRKGYSVIEKDGNAIHFQRSTRFRDFGSGVAYSIDGSEPHLQFLTKLEPLSEPNWYYYEEDFNEWKKQEQLQ